MVQAQSNPQHQTKGLVSCNLCKVEAEIPAGEGKSPPSFCNVTVIFFYPGNSYMLRLRADKAVEKERHCPLNPVQLDY